MTQLIGILNLTPDSFSDGGKYNGAAAVAHVRQLIADGAAVIDIGAESTRPGAAPLSHEEEWARLDGVLQEIIVICNSYNILTSLDTRHPESAKKAISLGIDWINDVDGFNNPKMIDAVKDSDVPLVVMHSLGVPADKDKTISEDVEPVSFVMEWARGKIAELAGQGIAPERLIFDPGIGFGKTAEQSWRLMENIQAFQVLGTKILVGHSRKSCLSVLSGGDSTPERDLKTIAVSITLAANGVDYLRVHDVASHSKVLNEGLPL
jgi:dihydropteroate synthase